MSTQSRPCDVNKCEDAKIKDSFIDTRKLVLLVVVLFLGIILLVAGFFVSPFLIVGGAAVAVADAIVLWNYIRIR